MSQHPLFEILVPWISSTDGSSCLILHDKHVCKNVCLNPELFPLISFFLGTAGPPYIHERLQSYTGIKTMVNKYMAVLFLKQSVLNSSVVFAV